MPTLWGRARFPGIAAVVNAEYTNIQGTEPGVALLTVAPQSRWPALGGTLQLTDGRVTITLPDCRVAKVVASRPGDLSTWQVAILDRRWKWQHGAISGHYNTRDRTGLIVAGTEQTPQQLAAMLFLAMGEARFDVGLLPNDARPQVDWELTAPARALTELCERLGCRVVYRVSTNSAAIVRLGIGMFLPKFDVMSYNATVDPPERPDELLFVGGPARFEAQFYLEPVGLDTDGSIKPIRDLSYRPAAPAGPQQTGWENSPRDFPNVSDAKTNLLARLSVFRWYRIKMVDPKTIKVKPQDNAGVPANEQNLTVTVEDCLGSGLPSVPGDRTQQGLKGSRKINALSQILPIEDERITPAITSTGGADGIITISGENDYAATVEGWFLRNTYDGHMTQLVTRYEFPYTIDRERGIVCFRDAVFMRGTLNGLTKKRPAILFLTCAFALRDAAREPIRYVKTFTFPGPRFGGQPEIVHRDEVVLQTALYGRKVQSNQGALDREANYYLLAHASRYQTLTPEDITYMGFKSVDVDGAIQQVTWSLAPATTRASRNTEHHLAIDSYRDRQMQAISRSVLDPEWIANINRQLDQLKRDARKPLGPGLRGG